MESQDNAKNNTESNSNRTTLYNFTEQGKGNWRVEDDVVMGGQSDSSLKMTENGYAHFSGRVSLENDGGFCSIHQTVEKKPYIIDDNAKAFFLRLNGDGKDYNFRVRTKKGKHSYAYTFHTKGDGNFESISIPFNQMEATFHGEPVEVPNYDGENLVEMQLLIGNQKEEKFEIFIQAIQVE